MINYNHKDLNFYNIVKKEKRNDILVLNIINSILFTFISLSFIYILFSYDIKFNLSLLIIGLLNLLFSFGIYSTLKLLKKDKEKFKYYKDCYIEAYKKVEAEKYIREQRKNKILKIKNGFN